MKKKSEESSSAIEAGKSAEVAKRDRRHSNFPHRARTKGTPFGVSAHTSRRLCHKKWEKDRELCNQERKQMLPKGPKNWNLSWRGDASRELVTFKPDRGRNHTLRWKSKGGFERWTNTWSRKTNWWSFRHSNRMDPNRWTCPRLNQLHSLKWSVKAQEFKSDWPKKKLARGAARTRTGWAVFGSCHPESPPITFYSHSLESKWRKKVKKVRQAIEAGKSAEVAKEIEDIQTFLTERSRRHTVCVSATPREDLPQKVRKIQRAVAIRKENRLLPKSSKNWNLSWRGDASRRTSDVQAWTAPEITRKVKKVKEALNAGQTREAEKQLVSFQTFLTEVNKSVNLSRLNQLHSLKWSVKHKEFKRRLPKETWRGAARTRTGWAVFGSCHPRKSADHVYSTALESKWRKKWSKFVKLLRLANRWSCKRDRRHSNFPHRARTEGTPVCFGPHLEKTCTKSGKIQELCNQEKKTDVAESLQEIETYLEEATQVGRTSDVQAWPRPEITRKWKK